MNRVLRRRTLSLFFFFFARHLLSSTRTPHMEADIISIQPASSPPVASHKGALGALAVNLYPHGTCWSP